MMEISALFLRKIMSYLLRKADDGDTEAEMLLDELNQLINLQRK